MKKSDLLDPQIVVHNRARFARICGGSYAVTGAFPNASYKFQKMHWVSAMLRVFPTVVWLDAFVVRPTCPIDWRVSPHVGVAVVVDTNLPDRYNAGVMVFQRGAAFDAYEETFLRFARTDPTWSDNHIVNRVLLRTNHPPSYQVLPSAFNSYPRLGACGSYRPHARYDAHFDNATVHHYPGLYSGMTPSGDIAACTDMQRRYYTDAHALDTAPVQKRASKHKAFVILTSYVPR